MTEFIVPGPKTEYPSELAKTNRGQKKLERFDQKTKEAATPREATMKGVIEASEERASR